MSSSRPEIMVSLLSKVEEQYDIKITFSVETEPLGTGAFSLSPFHPSKSRREMDRLCLE